MSSVYPSNPDQGITLRQAALVAGIFTYFGELIFMAWLLIRGWKIQEPTD